MGAYLETTISLSEPTRRRFLQGKAHCRHWGVHAGRRGRALQLPKAWKPARGGQHMSLTMCCAMCPTPERKQSASGSRLLHGLCDSFLEQSSIRSVSRELVPS